VGLIPSILWGLVYGFIWWFLGPLTLMSLMMGAGLQWTASAVEQTIQSLIWHLVFGGVLGVSYEALRRASLASPSRARMSHRLKPLMGGDKKPSDAGDPLHRLRNG